MHETEKTTTNKYLKRKPKQHADRQIDDIADDDDDEDVGQKEEKYETKSNEWRQ